MEDRYPECWLEHRVSYGETDAMGVVYHAEYIHFFERSRGELCRTCGLPYADIEAGGFMLPVKEVHCLYRSPARYDDLICIFVRVSEIRKASVRFEYAIYDASRTRLLCEGMTLHAFVDRSGRPVAIPGWIREVLDGSRAAPASL
ncbi:MAG: acyl-CoA thioesterase [Desulfovibrio sp.]|jgi:acyl-CoA thioester hydrolase|nr:acyl-CoA thioesterase [Mailhella sp.]